MLRRPALTAAAAAAADAGGLASKRSRMGRVPAGQGGAPLSVLRPGEMHINELIGRKIWCALGAARLAAAGRCRFFMVFCSSGCLPSSAGGGVSAVWRVFLPCLSTRRHAFGTQRLPGAGGTGRRRSGSGWRASSQTTAQQTTSTPSPTTSTRPGSPLSGSPSGAGQGRPPEGLCRPGHAECGVFAAALLPLALLPVVALQ